MTTHRYRRCSHCLVVYTYQASGHGCGEPLNDPRFCPHCMGEIIVALRAVPAKVEKVWVATTEVDLVTLLRHEEEHVRHCKEEGMVLVRRVSTPLFDLEGGRTQRTGIVSHEGHTYQYRFWAGQESEAEITEEVARDIETGRTEPWKDYR